MTALETFTTASKQPLTTGRRPDMAAFFTGAVRAPLTGIVLVSEMTANTTMPLPMLEACFAAMLVPALLRNAPIYDSLREALVGREQPRRVKVWERQETYRPQAIGIICASCQCSERSPICSSPQLAACRLAGLDYRKEGFAAGGAITRGAAGLTHEVVCKARQAADGCTDGLIQPRIRWYSSKNTGFCQRTASAAASPAKIIASSRCDENRRCRWNSEKIRRNSGFRARRADGPSRQALRPEFFAPEAQRQSDRITAVETSEWVQIGSKP